MAVSRFSSCWLVVCPITASMIGWGTLWLLPSVEIDCIHHRMRHFCAGRLLRPPELCGMSHISCDCLSLMHFAVLVKRLLFFSHEKIRNPLKWKIQLQILGTAETTLAQVGLRISAVRLACCGRSQCRKGGRCTCSLVPGDSGVGCTALYFTVDEDDLLTLGLQTFLMLV